MRKAFSLYTYIPIHEKPFLYTHVLNSFNLYQHSLCKTSIPFQRFLFSFFNVPRCLYKNFFIYTHCSHTRISFHTLFIHTKSFHTLFLYKNSFLFFIHRYDICSQRLFLFQFLVLS